MANTLRFKRGLLAGLPSAAVGEPLFTTDTFDLYIGTASGTQKYQKFIASGATTQILRGDGSLYTFPLNISSPTNGQVLKYNGTNWVNDSDAGITGSGTTNYLPKFTGASTLGNSLVFDNGTSVGIGSTTPAERFSVYGGDALFTQFTGTGNGSYLKILNSTTTTNGTTIQSSYFGSGGFGDLKFEVGGSQRFRVTSGGNFIINNASSDNGLRFQVTGDGYFSGSVGVGNSSMFTKFNVRHSNATVYSPTNSATWLSGINLYNDSTAALNISNLISFYGSSNVNSVFGVVQNASGVGDFIFSGYNGSTFGELMRLTGAGNLGLGVTPSAWGSIFRAFQFGATGTLVSGSGITNFGHNYYYDGANSRYLISSNASLYQQTLGQHIWYTSPSGTAGNAITFTQAMTLDASGNLLVGTTTNPGYGRQTISVYNSTGGIVKVSGTTTSALFYVYQPDNVGAIGTDTNHDFAFVTNNVVRARFSSSGNLLLGLASDLGYKLDVNGTMRVSGIATFGSQVHVPNSSNGTLAGYYFDYNTSQAASRTWRLVNDYAAYGDFQLQQSTTQTGSTFATILNISPTGAATFSSSVTTGSPITIQAAAPFIEWKNVASTRLGYIQHNATNLVYNADTGVHVFNQAATFSSSVTVAGNLIVDTNTLFVDASANRVGIGTASPAVNFEVAGSGSIGYFRNPSSTAATTYMTVINANNTSNGLVVAHISDGTGYIGTQNSAALRFVTADAEKMRITAAGRLLVGTTTESTFLLDVNGTMRVSGASTFGDITAASIGLGASASYPLDIQINGSNAPVVQRIKNTGTNTNDDALLYFSTQASRDFSIGLDRSSGLFNFTNGAASVSSGILLSIEGITGAATFSSSVTVGTATTGRVIATPNTGNPNIEIYGGAGSNSVGGSAYYRLLDATNSRSWIGQIDANGDLDFWFQYGGTFYQPTTFTKEGAATFSSSVQAGTAIAIGTTPDTNLPFKILKNINSTVGIRFENTSTGASAYSAVQFGTDVNGGTAFTNMVYGSSGITESGVYKPNGTSIINTGSGGLNFLAVSQPIRFFTSTGNGTLRAEIANDGFINHYTGTAPSTNLTDGYRQYSADITAGNAAPHFRTENGGIIKLYQQTTGVTSATYIGGAGTGLTDSDTFDGYTIAQIVKALRNAGLLA